MNRRNIQLVLPFSLLVFLFFIALTSYQPERYNDDDRLHFDLFLYSTYYFPESKSLGNNAIALVFTADFDLTEEYPQLEVRISSGEETKFLKTDVKLITPHQKCKWVDYYAIIPGVPDTSQVSIRTGSQFEEIPFVLPSSNFHDVVTCIAPLYASEQWQIALLAAHIYKRFGSHMHLYVRSMVSPLFEMLKEYERQNYLTIQPWYRIQMNTVAMEDFNPNMNVEFRNQAAAQTDCLLQYKERASFISFVDLDDILIPRLGATYFDEFDEIFNKFPSAAYLFYGKANTHAVAAKIPQEFSISSFIYSIKFQQKTEMGKFVTQPKLINSSWIHWPPSLPSGMKKHTVPASLNSITHLKTVQRVLDVAQGAQELPLYEPFKDWNFEPKTLLSDDDLVAIDDDFQRMVSPPRMRKLLAEMPEEFFYASLISDCYREFYKFYYSGQLTRLKCFGPERCEFPSSPGIPCYNADATYHSIDGYSHSIHFATSPKFHKNDGCIR